MRPSTTAASVGVGLLLLAWLASAVGVPPAPRTPRPPAQPSDGAHLEALRNDVQAQASRLRTRMAAAPAPRPLGRNPFAFANRDAGAPRTSAPSAAVPAHAPPIDAPPAQRALALIGVAERSTATGTTRTAILSGAGDELYMVTEGEEIAGEYRVRTIGADTVELERIPTGTIRHLPLK